MDAANDLIKAISQQLSIPVPASPDPDWQCRVIYSIAGKMALASLWDTAEDQSISVQHFKQRAAQIFEAYTALCPQAAALLPVDKNDLIDDIYSTYLRTGHFYHSPHHLAPAAPSFAFSDKVAFYRGSSPDATYAMSGLGFYSSNFTASQSQSISKMFDLPSQSLDAYLQDLLRDVEWAPLFWPTSPEFLRLSPPFSNGYWQTEPCRDGRISLARYGEPNKIYIFYRFAQGHFWQKPIPEWRLMDLRSNLPSDYGEYRRIANALLHSYNALPAIHVHRNPSNIEIHINYRLPPSEEDFFKLYSWPSKYFTAPQSFTRKMAFGVFPVFKQLLEPLGYQFREV